MPPVPIPAAAALPIRGLAGGLMIGSAAALLLLGLGRIAGISGLAARTVGLGRGTPWPIAAAFVLGLPLGALAVAVLVGPPALRFPPSWSGWAAPSSHPTAGRHHPTERSPHPLSVFID